MNQIRHSVLALALSVTIATAAAAQTTPGRLPHWIARPAASASTAFSAGRQSGDTAWRRVVQLKPGRPIALTVTGVASGRERIFVQADSQSITVINLNVLGGSTAVARALKDAVAHHTAGVMGILRGTDIVIGQLGLGQSGVFYGGKRLAPLDQVLERVSRDQVIRLTIPPHQQGSWVQTAVGAGLGFGVGLMATAAAANNDYPKHPRANAFVVTGVIWMPAAGGVLAYYRSRQLVPGTVVYERE